MLDFGNIFTQETMGNANVIYYEGTTSATSPNTTNIWTKPRGSKWVYMMVVGPGGNGGAGINTGTSSGGGGGGGSGGMTVLMLPSFLVPDTLHLSIPAGGIAANTYVSYGPLLSGTFQYAEIFAYARNGGAGGTATASAGGAAGTAGAIATVATGTLITRGFSTLLAGQAGIIGGAGTPVAGGNLTLPATGLMVTGGVGGGGSNTAAATPGAAGGIIAASTMPGQDFIPNYSTSLAASGATPAVIATSGLFLQNPKYFMSLGGAGGGGASGTAGGLAASGGNGGPGSGGGGGGGRNTTNTTGGTGGIGGPGFVLIISM